MCCWDTMSASWSSVGCTCRFGTSRHSVGRLVWSLLSALQGVCECSLSQCSQRCLTSTAILVVCLEILARVPPYVESQYEIYPSLLAWLAYSRYCCSGTLSRPGCRTSHTRRRDTTSLSRTVFRKRHNCPDRSGRQRRSSLRNTIDLQT
jgi:hypothetical protein